MKRYIPTTGTAVPEHTSSGTLEAPGRPRSPCACGWRPRWPRSGSAARPCSSPAAAWCPWAGSSRRSRSWGVVVAADARLQAHASGIREIVQLSPVTVRHHPSFFRQRTPYDFAAFSIRSSQASITKLSQCTLRLSLFRSKKRASPAWSLSTRPLSSFRKRASRNRSGQRGMNHREPSRNKAENQVGRK